MQPWRRTPRSLAEKNVRSNPAALPYTLDIEIPGRSDTYHLPYSPSSNFGLLATCMIALGHLACTPASAQSNEWAWINGPQAPQAPVYGTLGPSNVPPIRNFPASWGDNKGDLWVFGGDGADGVGKSGFPNASR